MSIQSFKVGDVTISGEVSGHGPPVVLLHGFPLDHEMWAPQIEALGHGHRVIAPDLRGFGQSTLAPGDVEAGVTMGRYAADVAAVLDLASVVEPVVLVGFSMGGYAAWQFALERPQRLRALVLCDTRAVGDSDEARAGRRKMAEAALEAGDATPALGMMGKLLAPDAEKTRPEVAAAVRAMIERQSAAAIAAAQRGMAVREDVRGRLGEIRVPCLALAGAHDAISPPAEMKEIAAALPQAQFVEIPAAGHMTTLENPEATTRALAEFLKTLP